MERFARASDGRERLIPTTSSRALRTYDSPYSEGMVYGPVSLALEPDGPLYGRFIPDQSQNRGYVNDPKLTAMLKGQRRIKGLEARRNIIVEMQRYIAEQQYYVYANSVTVTSTWQPYVKNYAPNQTFDYGSRVAALWLDR